VQSADYSAVCRTAFSIIVNFDTLGLFATAYYNVHSQEMCTNVGKTLKIQNRIYTKVYLLKTSSA